MPKPDKFLHMRISEEDLADLDDMRKAEEDFPTRSDMVRRLIERAKAASKVVRLRGRK
jgi:hypothetical protein